MQQRQRICRAQLQPHGAIMQRASHIHKVRASCPLVGLAAMYQSEALWGY